MWPQTAQELVIKEGAGHCLHYVEALPYQEGVKNPAGWLKTHIENAWPVRAPEEPPTLPVSAPPDEDGIQAPDDSVAPEPAPASASAEDEQGAEAARSAEASAGARAAAEEVQRHHAAGEFAGAIEACETLP